RVLVIIAILAMMLTEMALAPRPAYAGVPRIGTPIGVVTNAFFLNVRSGPSVAFPVIGVISRGQSFVLVGRSFDASWVQIRLSGFAVGWVRSFYIRSNIALF